MLWELQGNLLIYSLPQLKPHFCLTETKDSPVKLKLWGHSAGLQPERRLNVKSLKCSVSLFCKTKAHIFMLRVGYILCACKSVAGLINTPTDSQRNILQALCLWSPCMLCLTTPLSFLPRFPPTFQAFSCSLESLLNSLSSSGFPLSVWTVLYSFAALPWETYGPVQEAGHREDPCIALILSLSLGQVDGPEN